MDGRIQTKVAVIIEIFSKLILHTTFHWGIKHTMRSSCSSILWYWKEWICKKIRWHQRHERIWHEREPKHAHHRQLTVQIGWILWCRRSRCSRAIRIGSHVLFRLLRLNLIDLKWNYDLSFLSGLTVNRNLINSKTVPTKLKPLNLRSAFLPWCIRQAMKILTACVENFCLLGKQRTLCMEKTFSENCR